MFKFLFLLYRLLGAVPVTTSGEHCAGGTSRGRFNDDHSVVRLPGEPAGGQPQVTARVAQTQGQYYILLTQMPKNFTLSSSTQYTNAKNFYTVSFLQVSVSPQPPAAAVTAASALAALRSLSPNPAVKAIVEGQSKTPDQLRLDSLNTLRMKAKEHEMKLEMLKKMEN